MRVEAVTPSPVTLQAAGTLPAAPPGRWLRLRRRAGRATVGAALAWLIFILLHLILSGRVWWWILPDLTPPLAFTAVPLSLSLVALALRAGRRWVCGAAASALVLACAGGLTGLSWPDGAPDATGDVRVVAWNTEYWHQGDDRDRFYAYLRRQNADVYLLSEYLYWDDAGHVVRPYDDRDRLAREFPGYRSVATGELLTLSRLPITAHYRIGPGGVRAGDPPPSLPFLDQYTQDKVLRTDVRLPDATVVSLYNAHVPVQVDVLASPLGCAFYDFMRDRAAARRAVFRELDGDLAANPNPVLVAGDLNTSASMAELRTLRARLAEAPLSERSVYPGSWPADGVPLWRLDWAFVNPNLHADRYRLVDPDGLSDHKLQELAVAARRS